MRFHLAQANIALPREPIGSDLLADFVAALDPINALADRSPGFVWRLQTPAGSAVDVRAFGDERLIVNMSVWESIDALADYVYRSAHVEVMRSRRKWFEPLGEMHMVLWWIPAGHIPTIAEAEARLLLLREHGPTPHAFTFKRAFAPAGSETSRDDSCPV